MLTAELHPEEMLDAARAGTLSPRAAVDLNAHLARCQACRLHLKVADDFVADFTVDNRTARSEQALLAQLVRTAVAEPSAGATAGYRSAPRASRLLRRLMLPAACVLLGGGAATAMWSVRSDVRWLPEIEQLPAAQRQAPRGKARSHRVAAPARPVSSPAPTLEPAPAPSLEPVAPAPLPKAKAVRSGRPSRQPGESRQGGVVSARATTTGGEGMAPLAEATAPRQTAGSLFAEANHARRDGAYGKAISLYRQLRNQFSGSREEITARVIVGQLALAENHWTRALVEFDSYLAANPSGTLAEEAQVGRASALMRLSRGDAERDAWLQLLKRHPSSMHADRARARLEALRP